MINTTHKLKMGNARLLWLPLVFFTMVGVHCKIKQDTVSRGNLITVRQKAAEVYTDNFFIRGNANGSYFLVTKEIRANPQQLFPTVFFFIWSEDASEIIYQESLVQGKVKWISPYKILCESVPGRMNEREKLKKYTFDVRSRKTEIQIK
jgi:hypothetical protein